MKVTAALIARVHKQCPGNGIRGEGPKGRTPRMPGAFIILATLPFDNHRVGSKLKIDEVPGWLCQLGGAKLHLVGLTINRCEFFLSSLSAAFLAFPRWRITTL